MLLARGRIPGTAEAVGTTIIQVIRTEGSNAWELGSSGGDDIKASELFMMVNCIISGRRERWYVDIIIVFICI